MRHEWREIEKRKTERVEEGKTIRVLPNGTRHTCPEINSPFGEILHLLCELLDFVGLLHKINGENPSGIGNAELLLTTLARICS
jgi:hypothetical protein